MLRSALSCAALILLASCAPKKVESPLEKAPPARIAEARALASSGDVRGAQNAYETFIINHPGTTEADLARLELGILGSDIGRCQSAVPHFEQAQDSADHAIALRALLHLGACQLQLGDPERALQTIEPLAGERFSTEEQALLWDTAVIAAEQTTNAALALGIFDGLIQHGEAPPDPQRVDAVIDVLVQKLTIEETELLFDELRAGALPHVAVSMRLLNHALDTQDAEWVVRASDALRASDSISDPEVTLSVARADEFLHGNPYVVGALLPLSGRGREVGRQILQGMQLAALDEGGPELVVQDTAGDPSKTTAAVEALIGDQRVVAVLGPVGSRTTEAAAASTRRAGVPLLSFSASEETTSAGEQVFRFLYSLRDELTALVGKARARGLSRFVILYPDHGYGRTMERLFDQEVAAAGGVYCEGVAYPPGTKSFVDYVRTVLETTCDVVLFADVADQVALIAPTFAAEGAWSIAKGALPEHAEREVHFLLPSLSWSTKLVSRAGRYLQGALVALPFYEASEATLNQHFRTAYETRYGRPPQMFSAYGYDAYRLISATLRQGNQTRQALTDALKSGSGVTPVTSVDSFSSGRTPAHPPQVYEVQGGLLQSVE
ncbi:MAG: penicillin-binding protein activator [Deltaproteobacteria bacterium]|nr:penicillin-binding protein activator [Deltaproteobacteria bacterium]MBW1874738.1 penicillin-binding protein activator [Deltaproteobacteria bacterium]MBW2379085.1 penicillin-binding protein activator [Deltaproteobacteria bacterium]MBW2550102.1 penicillin-binding protein activator [Deltaproteobacteria bacterium]MBW2626486.1 penicillin-binding protein activator [Deltaproteobacteria bacterium]